MYIRCHFLLTFHTCNEPEHIVPILLDEADFTMGDVESLAHPLH